MEPACPVDEKADLALKTGSVWSRKEEIEVKGKDSTKAKDLLQGKESRLSRRIGLILRNQVSKLKLKDE